MDKYTVVGGTQTKSWKVITVADPARVASFSGGNAEQHARDHAEKLNALELPTEPGWYLDRSGEIWKLDVDCGWEFFGIGNRNNGPIFYTPFTRLYAESEVRELRAQAVLSVPIRSVDDMRAQINRAAQIRAEGEQ